MPVLVSRDTNGYESAFRRIDLAIGDLQRVFLQSDSPICSATRR